MGSETTLRCTSAFYALMSSFVRQCLEAVIYANQRKPAHADVACYPSWRAELFRVGSFLPKDKKTYHDMVFVDGDDSNRTAPTPDEDKLYERLYSDQVTAAAQALAMAAVAVAAAGGAGAADGP